MGGFVSILLTNASHVLVDWVTVRAAVRPRLHNTPYLFKRLYSTFSLAMVEDMDLGIWIPVNSGPYNFPSSRRVL